MATTEVPSGFVLPLFWGSAAPAPAVPAAAAQTVLLVEQALSNTGSINDPGSDDAAAARWGIGSAAFRAYKLAKAAHPFGQISVLAIADAAGTKRELTITYDATSDAEAGTHRIRVGSDYVDVPLPAYATSTAATEHAAALACDAAFPAASEIMFKSKEAATLGVATIICRHFGTIGNQVRIATDEDVALPTGWTVTIAQSVAGATDPTLDVDDLGPSQRWNKIAFGLDGWYEDYSAEMVSRWGYARMLRGHAFSATTHADYDAAITDLTTTPRTVQYVSRGCLEAAVRAPAFEVAAVMAAATALSDQTDPGLKVGGLTLPGCQCARTGSEYSAPQRNTITYYGGVTFHNVGGLLAFDRCVTTRYQNSLGTRDLRAYDAPKMWLVDYLLSDLQATVQTLYERVRLLSTTEGKVPPNCASLGMIRDDLVAWYARHQRNGLVQGLDEFKANLTVVIPEDDPNRVDVRLPMNVAKNLEIFAALMTY